MRYGIVIKSTGKKFASKTHHDIDYYMMQNGFERISDEIFLTDAEISYNLEYLFNFIKDLRKGLMINNVSVPFNVFVFKADEWSNLTGLME